MSHHTAYTQRACSKCFWLITSFSTGHMTHPRRNRWQLTEQCECLYPTPQVFLFWDSCVSLLGNSEHSWFVIVWTVLLTQELTLPPKTKWVQQPSLLKWLLLVFLRLIWITWAVQFKWNPTITEFLWYFEPWILYLIIFFHSHRMLWLNPTTCEHCD